MKEAEEKATPPGLGRDKVQITLGIDHELAASFPLHMAREYKVLPLCRMDDSILVAVQGFLSPEKKEKLEGIFKSSIQSIPAQMLDLNDLAQQAGEQSETVLKLVRALSPEDESSAPDEPAFSSLSSDPKPLKNLLADLGLVSEKELLENDLRLSDEDTASIDPSLFVDSDVLGLIPATLARRHRALPLMESSGHLVLAVAQQLDKASLTQIKLTSGMDPKLVFADATELDQAIDRCYRRVNQLGFEQMKLGEILLAQGLISREQLDNGLAEQKKSGKKLGEVLVESGFATEEMIYSALADKLSCEYSPFNFLDVDIETSRLVSKRFAESHLVLPIRQEGKQLVVSMANPHDLAVVDLLKKLSRQRGHTLKVVIATPTNIQQGIAYTFNSEGLANQDLEMETVTTDETERTDLILNSEMPKIKKILNHVLHQAVVQGASDIHIENLETRVRARFRIDGILHMRETPINKDNIGQVISVLKIDSDLDITERRRPQDGGFKKRIGKDWFIDFRVNVHCTEFGGDAVIRILDTTKKLPKLDQLGLPDEILRSYLKLVQNPQGLVLITGPTGSGKSTTLYSTLAFLNRVERKIVTAEDPVEYHLDGINQYKVNAAIGNTFAEYGRRFLRKDPDIILIGETRDEVTAESCFRAASTGHLVFSTLHTNRSTGAVQRLRDLGIDGSSLCDALLAVVAQRLVRKSCEQCLEEYRPGDDVLEEFYPQGPAQHLQFMRGKGCNTCNHTGYKGRIGVYEFWELNREARHVILSGGTEEELWKAGGEAGLKAIVADALAKVYQGVTTLEELRRVVPLEQIRTYARAPHRTDCLGSAPRSKGSAGNPG